MSLRVLRRLLQQKYFYLLPLVALLVFSVLINDFFAKKSNGVYEDEGPRHIASVSSDVSPIDMDWQKSLVSKLSDPVLKRTAAFGQRPDSWSEFEFGALKGHYRLSRNKESLSAITLFDEVSEDQAIVISPEVFLNQHRFLFHPHVAKVILAQPTYQMVPSSLYHLIGTKGEVLGDVHVHLTPQGGLLNLNVTLQ